MANKVCREEQLTFTLGIISPLSIPVYGMLMQVSKSVKEAVKHWEAPLFDNHRVSKLLSMACTTKRGKGRRDPSAKIHYICTRAWREHLVSFCFRFYIPMRDCGIRKRKRSFKDILGDYVVYMQSIDNTQKKGIICVKFRDSFQGRDLENRLLWLTFNLLFIYFRYMILK